MSAIDFLSIVKEAWQDYDSNRKLVSVENISAMVSTNHVFRLRFEDHGFLVAKLSWFGTYEHFKEDHTIIHALSDVLHGQYENFLARSLLKDGEVYTYRSNDYGKDVWVVFYHPIKAGQMIPRRLNDNHIQMLGREIALFHKACADVTYQLPASSKTLQSDVIDLLDLLEDRVRDENALDLVKRQGDAFLNQVELLNYSSFQKIPIFVDWNIGNFSVSPEGSFFSRWDYDWFRVCSRVLDFYFMSRVVSDIGDRTVFSYLAGPMMEPRFIAFLKAYHAVYPLTELEIRFLKEAYRFFILNYVVKYGWQFFRASYAEQLQREAFSLYLPQVDQVFDVEKLLQAILD